MVAVCVGRRDGRAGGRARPGDHQGPRRDRHQRQLSDRRRDDACALAVSDAGARGGVCRRRAAQPHRRPGDRQAPPDADSALGAGRRRGVHSPRVPGCGRHLADAERGRGLRLRHRARQARASGGRPAATSGVRGLLDLQVVGLAAGVEPVAQPQQRPRVLRLDSRQRRGQHALEPLCLRVDHGQRTHRRERRRQLLPDSPQPDRDRRELHAGVSRHHPHVRALPQPPDGEVDANRLLRVCEPLRAGRHERGRRRQRQGRHGDHRLYRRGRHPASATGSGDATAPARRRAHGQPLAGGSPRLRRGLADLAGQHSVRPHRRQSHLGQLFRPRPGAPVRRPALFEPGQQRAAARRAERGLRRRRLRSARADAHHHDVGCLSEVGRDHAWQREGRPVLLALSHATAAGRSHPRRVFAGHRRARRLRRVPARDPGHAAARHACRLVLPQRLRASRARADVVGRAHAGPDVAAGAAHHQRRDAEHQADGRLRRDCQVGGRWALERRRPERALLVGARPPSERSRAHAGFSRVSPRTAPTLPPVVEVSRTSRGPCSRRPSSSSHTDR